MSLTRIKFSDTDGSNIYSLAYNPDNFDAVDSANMVLVNVLDGSPARISGSFDNRVRTMTWPFYPASDTSFMAMVNELKSYKGLNKKLDLEDVDAPYSYGWRNIKVTDVKTSLKEGGSLRVSLTLEYVYTSSYSV
jgi:hypothetical protein